jgi:hypothetical protein
MKAKKLNKFPTVVTSPTPANRLMNPKAKVSLNPSNANKSLNAPARVKPKSY